MKKTILLAACVAGAFALTACSSTNASKISAPTFAESKTIVATPDVESGAKISGEGNVTNILGGLIVLGDNKYADGVKYTTDFQGGFFAFFADSAQGAKDAAAYNACVSSGSDVILIPNYVLEKKDYFVFNTIKATVTGYKGVIKGVKSVECKDYKELYFINNCKK